MSQMSLGDVLAPTISGVEGPADRPRRWLVSYPDGAITECRRSPSPGRIMVRAIYADGTAGPYATVPADRYPSLDGYDTSD